MPKLPVAASDAKAEREIEVRSWTRVLFNRFEPIDDGSSLRRKWQASIHAVRSDLLIVNLPIAVLQSDTPMRLGEALEEAFTQLEQYRTCACTKTIPCTMHREERMQRAG